MLKVTVDRKTWLRGEGSYDSYLLRRSDRKMCCLGFACLAAGMGSDDIVGQIGPTEYLNHFPEALAKLLTTYEHEDPGAENVCNRLIIVNDTNAVDDAERERLITEKGKLVDIEFEFEG